MYYEEFYLADPQSHRHTRTITGHVRQTIPAVC